MTEEDGDKVEWDEEEGDGCEGCGAGKALGEMLELSIDKRLIGPISMAVSCGKWPRGMPGCNLIMGMPSFVMPCSGMMDITPKSFKARSLRSSRCSRLRRGTTYFSPSRESEEGRR